MGRYTKRKVYQEGMGEVYQEEMERRGISEGKWEGIPKGNREEGVYQKRIGEVYQKEMVGITEGNGGRLYQMS